MLRDLVEETVNAPGTAITINLGGPLAGRKAWISASTFAGGDQAYYFLTDGSANSEWGIATLAAGTPNTLSRTTVLGNTAGTVARLNFTGTCIAYNWLPAARTPMRDATGRLPMSELPYEVAWNVIEKVLVTTAVGAVDFTLPEPFVRFRLEFSEFTPAATATMFARVNQGAGFLAGASDYQRSLGIFGSGVNTSGGGAGAEITMSDGTSEGVFGSMEFVRPASGARAVGMVDTHCTRATGGIRVRLVGGFQMIPTSPLTAVRLGFVGNNVAGGRVRLLGGLP